MSEYIPSYSTSTNKEEFEKMKQKEKREEAKSKSEYMQRENERFEREFNSLSPKEQLEKRLINIPKEGTRNYADYYIKPYVTEEFYQKTISSLLIAVSEATRLKEYIYEHSDRMGRDSYMELQSNLRMLNDKVAKIKEQFFENMKISQKTENVVEVSGKNEEKITSLSIEDLQQFVYEKTGLTDVDEIYQLIQQTLNSSKNKGR